MKKIVIGFALILILVLIFYSMITTPILGAVKQEKNVAADPMILKGHVEKLSGTGVPRNYNNLQALNETAAYVLTEMQKYCRDTEEQGFMVDSNEYKNIICSFGPKNGERIIIGAHYDVCGDQPGADDNASGVAGLLEIARLIDLEKPDLKYRIDLVAYSLEEPPFFRSQNMGSAVHANYLKTNNIRVKAMISLEMIGYFSDHPGSQSYPLGIFKLFYPTTANYIAVVGKFGQGSLIRKVKKLMLKGSAIDVRSINAPVFIPGIDFSDHLNYWNNGYDAVMVSNTSFYRNANYHQTGDKPETLDYQKMAEVVKGVYWAVLNL
jgi:hypothetical protein